MESVRWIANNIFSEPVILLGFIVLLGLISQGKSLSDICIGVVKAMLGFLIISEGAGIIVRSLLVFEPLWSAIFGLKGSNFSNFIGQEAFNASFGSAVTLSMTFGFLINIILARFTKFKYIYLTGHMMFWTTMIFAGVLVNSKPNISFGTMVMFLSLLMGVYWTLQPALVQPFMRGVTKNDSIALGHTSASVAILGALCGKIVGIGSKDSEDMELPDSISFLRDSNVVTSMVMLLLFLVGGTILLLKPETEQTKMILSKSGNTSFFLYVIKQSLLFAAGIAVTLFGVRMFIGEIVPAFKGFSDKIVPNAKPALDCPLIFPYAPNAVILGFLGAFIGGLFWMVILGNSVGYVFVPTMIVLFFHGGTAGVFGNSTGGIRGALFAGFITATVVAVGQWLMVSNFIKTTIPDTALWAADSDMFFISPFIAFIAAFLP